MIPEEYNGLTTKPELSEELLIHYGVPGMKWGVRKARPVSLGLRRRGTASSGKVVKSRPKAKKVKTKGYSKRQYDKYRSQGMSHTQAEAAAKEHRKKVVAGVVVGAAALSLTALAAHKMYKGGFNLKGKSQQQVFNERIAKDAARKDYHNFKFKNQQDYMRAKTAAVNTEYLKAGKKGDINEFAKWIDEDTVKKYGRDLLKYDRRYRKYR